MLRPLPFFICIMVTALVAGCQSRPGHGDIDARRMPQPDPQPPAYPRPMARPVTAGGVRG